MAKEHKGDSAPRLKETSKGEHGGNRGGDSNKDEKQSPRSSQAAGKDPNRGKSEK